MFRIALLALALIAVGALLAGGIGSAGALFVGGLFFIGKLFFILLLFGLIGGFFWRSYDGSRPWGPRGWSRPPSRRREPQGKSREDQFEDWHRVAHAREEVDGWVGEIDDE